MSPKSCKMKTPAGAAAAGAGGLGRRGEGWGPRRYARTFTELHPSPVVWLQQVNRYACRINKTSHKRVGLVPIEVGPHISAALLRR